MVPNNAEFYADFETVEKNVKNLQLFLGGFFFNYFHRFKISVKFCNFEYSYAKKEQTNFGVLEYIYEYANLQEMA